MPKLQTYYHFKLDFKKWTNLQNGCTQQTLQLSLKLYIETLEVNQSC